MISSLQVIRTGYSTTCLLYLPNFRKPRILLLDCADSVFRCDIGYARSSSPLPQQLCECW